MGFRLLILDTGPSGEPGKGNHHPDWPEKLYDAVPDIVIDIAHSVEEARELITGADAAFGYVAPEIFEKANKLRWIASPQAGPPAGFYYQALIESEVVVTNVRGVFNDHIGAHIMSYVLTFARGLHIYMHQQTERIWKNSWDAIHLPEATAVVVGVGGIGGEAARLCASFGMTVIGVDARTADAPPGVSKLYRPEDLDDALPHGDFVIVTVPETPETQGLFTAEKFGLMKPSAFLINTGRGATVVLDDLNAALRGGVIAGAALDVFEVEPLPEDHPLWNAPGMIVTPHVAASGPYVDSRRSEVFIDNCIRFNDGRALRNVVDKAHWF